MKGKIEVYFVRNWCYARQGMHRASVPLLPGEDIVRRATDRRAAYVRAVAALVTAKLTQQQLQRPPAVDSRPRRCHAKPRAVPGACEMVCRPCRLKWNTLDAEFPACKGDEA